ncbi:Protein of unknown function [Cotesia congregata]|uniref:Uncharacterized protein n=1 Tax=Cotesia congregata TaxID=51543 RepID=A0A8J2HDL0_COTCN|nr:Protein of unknown function [Cotesia congregata]
MKERKIGDSNSKMKKNFNKFMIDARVYEILDQILKYLMSHPILTAFCLLLVATFVIPIFFRCNWNNVCVNLVSCLLFLDSVEKYSKCTINSQLYLQLLFGDLEFSEHFKISAQMRGLFIDEDPIIRRSHRIATKNNNIFNIPNFVTATYEHSFVISAIRFWQNLPPEIFNSLGLKSFKTRVFDFLRNLEE